MSWPDRVNTLLASVPAGKVTNVLPVPPLAGSPSNFFLSEALISPFEDGVAIFVIVLNPNLAFRLALSKALSSTPPLIVFYTAR